MRSESCDLPKWEMDAVLVQPSRLVLIPMLICIVNVAVNEVHGAYSDALINLRHLPQVHNLS